MRLCGRWLSIRAWAIAMLALCAMAAPSLAQTIISAPEALAKARAGDIVVVDVRSREEWRETGIASVAVPISMHEKDFLTRYQKLVAENPGKQIAIICATGGRTQWLQAELSKRGLGETIDVSEGMMGNRRGAGWIARGLPIVQFAKQ